MMRRNKRTQEETQKQPSKNCFIGGFLPVLAQDSPCCPTPYGKGCVDVCIGRELLFDYDVNEKYSPSLKARLNHESLVSETLEAGVRPLSAMGKTMQNTKS